MLRGYDGLVVAYSGGADSAFLAVVAHQVLGERMVAVTAVSPSLAAAERADASAFAAERGFRQVEVETDELERAAYTVNDANRCFWCKDALMDAVGPIAAELGASIALGVNLDDLGDHRPGQSAAAGRGAVFPLVDAGFTKADVRAASRKLRPAHVGQAGGAVPGVAGAVRHRGHRRPARAGRAGRGRPPRPGVPRAAGARRWRHRHGSRCPSTTSPASSPSAMPWWPRCTAPATAGSCSTSRASAAATSTPTSPADLTRTCRAFAPFNGEIARQVRRGLGRQPPGGVVSATAVQVGKTRCGTPWRSVTRPFARS